MLAPPPTLTPAAKLALAIFRRFPPRETIFLDPESRPATEYDDECANPIRVLFAQPPDWLSGKDILDLGSGFGGRTVRFAEQARSVVGLEVSRHHAEVATAFAAQRGSAAKFMVGMGEKLPLPDRSADLVIVNDVMEHVIDPRAVVDECFRVLRPGGELAVTFPPYYGLRGGSHLHGYATRVPGLNLVFPTRALKAASLAFLRERGIDPSNYFRDAPTDKLWNMNGITISSWYRLTRDAGFKPKLRRRVAVMDSRYNKLSLTRAPIAWACRVAAEVPVMREAMTERVVDILEKPQAGR